MFLIAGKEFTYCLVDVESLLLLGLPIISFFVSILLRFPQCENVLKCWEESRLETNFDFF